jgi:xylulokinase
MQADVFGQPVCTLQAEEGPAYGVALLAAVGAGAYNSIEEACEATVQLVSETKTDRKSRQYYNRAFPIYQDLYGSLKDDFVRIAQLGG